MNILIIPEDFRKDQWIVEPILQAMLKRVGKPNARVRVCRDPLLGSDTQALRWGRVKEILERYRGMVDLFLLLVDRDGKPERRSQLDNLEKRAQHVAPLLAENAWQELEVWLLAGLYLPKNWSWAAVRNERDPKDLYYLPLAQQRDLLDAPGEGRKQPGQEAARRYPRIRQLCPEDVERLENRIIEYLNTA